MNILAPMTITGPGAGSLTVSGGGNYLDVLYVNSTGQVSISGLTIADGAGYSTGSGYEAAV